MTSSNTYRSQEPTTFENHVNNNHSNSNNNNNNTNSDTSTNSYSYSNSNNYSNSTSTNNNQRKYAYSYDQVKVFQGDAAMGRSFRLVKKSSNLSTKSIISNKGKKNNIPLPPSQGQGRSRTESMSSFVDDSVISAPVSGNGVVTGTGNRARSASAGRSVYSNSNYSNGNGRSKSTGRSISARSSSVRSRSSLSRRSNSNNSSRSRQSRQDSTKQLSTSSPRFLPWAFTGVKSRLLPSDLEIADYDHSVLLNGETSMSDSVSTLKDGSEGGSSYSYTSNTMNMNMNMNMTLNAGMGLNMGMGMGMVKDKPLTMDTIHSSYTAKHSHPEEQQQQQLQQLQNQNQYQHQHQHQHHSQYQYPATSSPQPMSVLATQRRMRMRPPLHQHSRSHSADFVDFLQQHDTLLSKKLSSPNEMAQDYGAMSSINNTFTISEKGSNSNSNSINTNGNGNTNTNTNTNTKSNTKSERERERDREREPLIRHQTEPLNRTSSTALTVTSTTQQKQQQQQQQYDLSRKQYKYDLSKQFDLYQEEIDIPASLSHNWESRVSLLDQNSAGHFSKLSKYGKYGNGSGNGNGNFPQKRSFRRRLFLLLTEPQTSYLSLAFFTIYFLMLLASVLVMMMQTMHWFQYTPSNCDFCDFDRISGSGGDSGSFFNTFPSLSPSPSSSGIATDDTVFNTENRSPNVPCVCAPVPVPQIIKVEDWIIYFFSLEWTLRVVSYVPLKTESGEHRSFFTFLCEPYTIFDFCATFPYYLIRYHQIEGIVSLRLLRFFRVFQLLRLKKYDIYLTTMVRVLMNSMQALHIYLLTLLFLAAVFGSVIYWFEKGEWKYTDLLEEPGYAFVRKSADGITEELSPFHSIPGSFWWFFVTATTAGYGDAYPTSACGKIVAVFALLCSVLVIAFPVSIFSELWQKELHEMGELNNLYKNYNESSDDADDDYEDDGLSFQSSEGEERKAPVKFISTTSSHNFHGSENDFPLETSNSFTSMVLRSHDDLTHDSNNSVVKTGFEKQPKDNGGVDDDVLSHSESDSSSPAEFTAKDAADLRRYVESIEEAQQNIRKILTKLEPNQAL